MRVLVVVDVQHPYLTAADTAYVKRVARLVEAARSAGYFICFLQQRGPSHHVHADLLHVVEGYRHWGKATKGLWNGSMWVQQMIRENGIVPSHFLVCGAFTEECVLATLEGLRYRYGGTPLVVCRNECLNRRGPFDWSEPARLLNLRFSESLL
jgi:nicotinamidase-related amidase